MLICLQTLAIALKIMYNEAKHQKEMICMANTTAVYARIDTELKESAEGILSKLGISPSGAIQMLYSQIVLCGGMPFELRLPEKRPVAEAALTKAELDAELAKGTESLRSGKTYTADEVDALMKQHRA